MVEDSELAVFSRLAWFLIAPLAFFLLRMLYRRLNPGRDLAGPDTDTHHPMSELFGKLAFATRRPVREGQLTPRVVPLELPTGPFAHPERVAQLMASFKGSWCIAGGWALSLAAGKPIREHSDIEVAVLRCEQQLVREHLTGWQPQYVSSDFKHQIQHWLPSTTLELPIHEIHNKPPQADMSDLEFLLNETSENRWVYRRDPGICLELKRAILVSDSGLPVLAPEIVLLYKSKHCRVKDELDFNSMLPLLTQSQRKWLEEALIKTASNHRWISRLQNN